MVYILQNFCCLRRAMSLFQVLPNPVDEVVLEGSLDKLMQQIWREQLMYICTRKFTSERLEDIIGQLDGVRASQNVQ